MANPGVGNRFASVNLNKSYGQSSHLNNNNSHNYGSGRARSSGGGMVALSRPRSSHKAGPKLSVPSPLNLPSLRKEHERFDSLGSGTGSVGGGVAGSGSRPSSSGVGWSKPSVVAVVERDGVGGDGSDRPLSSDGVDGRFQQSVDGVNLGDISAYMLPSARTGAAGTDVSGSVLRGKATVLRGEDFPSLRATLTAANVPSQKQKDLGNQKQRQGMSEEPSGGEREGSNLNSRFHMRPQVQSSQHGGGNSFVSDNRNSANSRSLEQGRKQDDYFPGPLPLVRLSPRSDWEDDERDTSHGLSDRGRDHGYMRPEAYWDRDFDLSRSSFVPNRPAQNNIDRRGQRDDDVGKGLSNEVSNADPFSRDTRAPSKEEGCEGRLWRTSLSKDGFASQEFASDKNSIGARPISTNQETYKENKHVPPQLGGNIRDEHNGGTTTNRDFATGKRDPGYGQGGRHQWSNSSDPNSGKGAERNIGDPYGSESNRHRIDAVQNSLGSRSSFSTGNRVSSGRDHLPNFGRDRRSFSRGDKPYVEDPFLKDWSSTGFDGGDPFSGGILGVVKRKKDANKQLDFHDPVRESFEAELERVQKVQELERQRIIEEQERAMEMARREEEERQRVAREQEEHQRRLEEEAQEAAWRAEQERLEAIRRAEEQRIAREEEKQRILMEEERRKQAAKQKLLELEERIARRQAEAAKEAGSAAIAGDIVPASDSEREVSRADDFAGWEDGERMVERITNSASSDSSLSRPFDMGSRSALVRDDSFAYTDRGKPFSSWRRDVFENENSSSFFSPDHENGHQSPRCDPAVGGKAFLRKDFYGGAGYMPTRGHYRGGFPEPLADDFPHARGHRWNVSGDGDPYGRNTELEAEFHDSIGERFDVGWGQGRGRGNSPFPERLYQNSELDDVYTYGRSRYPARQPRVLPPPSLPLVHRTSFRNEGEQAGSSAYEDGNIQFNHAIRSEPTAGSHHDVNDEHPDSLDVPEQDAKSGEQELNRSTTPGCDSQSSLSVSSPPSSPTHLSHDDLDESRDSLAVACTAEGQDTENEAVLLNAKAGKGNAMTTASSISVGDDEEWAVDDNEELQEQEEYDEYVGYHEEDEVHEGDDETVELHREFEHLHLEEKGSPHMMDNLVLGFDQGVEVGMPNDEYERSPRVEENLHAGLQVTAGVMEQKEPLDGNRSGQSPLVADDAHHVSIDGSSTTIQDTGKTLQDYASESLSACHTSASLDPLSTSDSSSGIVLPPQHSVLTCPPLDSSTYPLSTSDSSSGIVLPPQQLVPSPVWMNSQSSSQTVMPTLTGSHGPAELPVKLQFGLFSGPSLIPSPVPAIQIGSIQMPLQLHPQIGPSLSHLHAPQPPLFQFGQLRYPSPISQGIYPLTSQSLSFVQPNALASYPSSQKPGGPLSVQPLQDSSSQSSFKDDALLLNMNSHHIQPANQFDICQDTELKEGNLLAGQSAGSNAQLRQNQAETSNAPSAQVRPESGEQAERVERFHNVGRNLKRLLNNRASEVRRQGGPSSSHSATHLKDSNGPAAQGQLPGSKSRRFTFAARNPGTRLSSGASEASHSDANGFQRRPRRGTQRFEFRVRQTADRKQTSALVSSNYSGLDAKSNYDVKGSGMQPKSGMKKELLSDKPIVNSEISSSDQITKVIGSGIEEDKPARKEASTLGLDTSRRVEGSLKRNICSEDDVDAPLQSGIVRVFKQPGIEAPSDEDDFIEVRSKRQMLNDRREQREKEIKAKSSNVRKAQRKSRPALQGTANARNSGRTFASPSAQRSMHTGLSSACGSANNEVAESGSNTISQPLAPVGTPPVNAGGQSDAKAQITKAPQANSYSTSKQTAGSDLTFDAKSKVPDGVQSSLGSWDDSRVNQLDMALTQTQLEEAMKPVRFDTHVVSVGNHTSSVNEPVIPSSSVLAKDRPFSSASSPISSLLAGERIQFGAVTSPTILPPTTRVVSHGIRPPASSQLDIKISPSSDSDCALLFEKEKHSNESCLPLEDCEAEAEAAASAVAVAAIGNDEVVGNGIGSCSAAISDPKNLDDADTDGTTAGMSTGQHTINQSKAEENLSVSLPADLSVETPPISLWPPLHSPHGSCNQMLSPFPGGPTSHFPFYDMSPMVGGPVFALGPHEEPTGPQSQPQKTSASTSGPLATWQQCHTGVDSFYGPPSGFTAPFISPPGNIPGVQGPPHMVVYNHFAPVGQYGQVGLSYMGTTYIPSGKHPDWKRNPTSSAMGCGEGEMTNANMVPHLHNASNVSTQVQHLAPGSPLLSMPSPLAMFEMSPFQSSSDVPVNPRWSHVQAPSLHSIPQPKPLQQQGDGALPSQFSHESPNHHPLTASKPQTSSSFEGGHSYTATTQFPELGLVGPPASTGPEAPSILNVGNGSKVPTRSPVPNSLPEASGSKRNQQGMVSASQKAPSAQKNTSGQQHYNNYQRGSIQKNGSVSEWSNRRMGFHGRNHSSGGERGYPPSKIKQIYVAKQSTGGTSAL